jgi:hypothetical protein
MSEWLYQVEVDRIDPEVEDEWNRWYDTVHVPEMTTCPGWLSGTRYVTEENGVRRYVCLYELDGPEALQSKEFQSLRGWGKFQPHVHHVARLWQRHKPV